MGGAGLAIASPTWRRRKDRGRFPQRVVMNGGSTTGWSAEMTDWRPSPVPVARRAKLKVCKMAVASTRPTMLRWQLSVRSRRPRGTVDVLADLVRASQIPSQPKHRCHYATGTLCYIVADSDKKPSSRNMSWMNINRAMGRSRGLVVNRKMDRRHRRGNSYCGYCN